MIERNVIPVLGRVAFGAILFIVDRRLVLGMTVGADALLQMRVRDRRPVVGDVTIDALTRIMDGILRRMARLAVREALVIEPCLRPIIDDVAVGALAGVVVFGRIVFRVTRRAVVEAEVVEDGVFPVRGVGVTADARLVDQIFGRWR